MTGNGVTYLSTWTVDESTGDQVYSLISVAADGTVRSTPLPGYRAGNVQLRTRRHSLPVQHDHRRCPRHPARRRRHDDDHHATRRLI